MINLYLRTNYLKVKKLIFFHKWRFFDCHKSCYICRSNMLWFLCLCWHLWSLLLYIFRYLPSLQEVYLLDISTNSIWLILKSRRKILINWTKQKITSQRNERPYFIPQINSRFIICEKIILFLFLFQPYSVEF